MLVINQRKKLFLKLETVYYPEDYSSYKSNADIVLFYFSSKSIPGARLFNTLQIDLTRDEDRLLAELHKSTRHDILKTQKEASVDIVLNENPNARDITAFCDAYDLFVQMKGIKAADRDIMRKFMEKNALTITSAHSPDGSVLCSLTDIIAGDTVFGLYAYSNFRSSSDSKYRRMVANANRYLYWKNILNLKEKGFRTLDLGGLGMGREGSGMDNVDSFKLGFGGSIVQLYQFYYPLTPAGWLAVKAFNMNSRIEF